MLTFASVIRLHGESSLALATAHCAGSIPRAHGATLGARCNNVPTRQCSCKAEPTHYIFITVQGFMFLISSVPYLPRYRKEETCKSYSYLTYLLKCLSTNQIEQFEQLNILLVKRCIIKIVLVFTFHT
jgi:hypothetical protein